MKIKNASKIQERKRTTVEKDQKQKSLKIEQWRHKKKNKVH